MKSNENQGKSMNINEKQRKTTKNIKTNRNNENNGTPFRKIKNYEKQ